MSKIFYNRIYCLFLLFFAAAFILPACKKDKIGLPVISGVRNYDASPNDTAVLTVNAGQWIVVQGKNLSGVTSAFFGGIPASINTTLVTDVSIVIQIPDIPFPSVARDKLNEIMVVTESGTATYKINIIGAPIISYVKTSGALPNDTIAKAIFPGQKINIVGYNLKNATKIAFQGVAANLTNVVYTDSTAIVQVPADLSGGDATLANTISYTNSIGTGTFSIAIIGPPIIIRVSNENPATGDSVYLYGNNFFSVNSLTFAGASITSYKVTDDGNSIGFVVPALTGSGPVVIKAVGGTFTTAFNVNDISTGAISNFEWSGVFHWDWWGGASLESGDPSSGWPPYDAAFPGNSSLYLALKNNILNAGAGDEFSTAIRIGGVQWLPAGNLSDPVNSWALKFETNIPGPWNGGTLSIKTSNDSYRARYEPWQISPTSVSAYSGRGWQTVTIPLSSFRKNDATLGEGKGAPVATITDLLGNTGLSDLILYMHNYGSSSTQTSFNGAFDNFRVVKR